jgi:serine/threonine protein kinase
MGTVYEALDTALERRVAVKVIRDDLAGSAEAAERFRREAAALLAGVLLTGVRIGSRQASGLGAPVSLCRNSFDKCL